MPRKSLITTCSIDGCNRPHAARGWCHIHWRHWRDYGDPLVYRMTQKGAPAKWLSDHREHSGSECLIWPFGLDDNGYPKRLKGRKRDLPTRIMCEFVHGPAPSAEHQAAHSCGKGHTGCINPQHLDWKTPKENSDDRKMHGTHPAGSKNGFAKLTEKDIPGIRDSGAKEPYADVARRYGVSTSTVAMIRTRRNWRHVP